MRFGIGRITANSAAIAAARLVAMAASVAAVSIVARRLGTGSYGVFSYALNCVLLVQFFTDFGLTQTTVAELARHPEARDVTLGVMVRTRVVLGSIVALGLLCFAIVFHRDAVTRETVAVSAALLCVGSLGAISAYFQANLMTIANTVTQLAQPVTWLCLSVLVLRTTTSPVVLMSVYVVSALAGIVVIYAIAVWYGKISLRLMPWSWPAFRALAKDSAYLGLAGLFVTLYYRLDSILLFHLAGPQSVGLYNAAYRLLDQVQFLPQAIMGSLFPVLVYEQTHDPERFRRIMQGGFDVLLAVGVPAAVGACMLAAPIVAALFGPAYHDSALLMSVLAPTIISIFVGYLAGYLVVVARVQRVYVLVAGGGAVANIAANLILIPRLGPLGAAIATLGTEFPVMCVTLILVLGATKASLSFARLWRIMGASGVMALGLHFISFSNVAEAIVAGVALYAMAAFLLRVVTWQELIVLRSPPPVAT